MGPVIVVLDANVLFPAPLRDLLIRLAIAGLLRVRWTEVILDETFRNILRVRPELDQERLLRTRTLMNKAVRDVLVTNHERHIPQVELPDADDRHVAAAAIECGADYIVTWNLKDFPKAALEAHGVRAIDPDDLLVKLVESRRGEVMSVVHRQAASLRHPTVSVPDLLDVLYKQGLRKTVGALRQGDDPSG